MKQNTFITFGVLAFLVLLSVSFASATLSLTTITGLPSPLNESASYNVVLNVTNSGNDAVNISWARTISSPVTLTVPTNLILGSNQSALQTFTYAIPANFIGALSSTIYANANNSESANKSFSSTSQQTPSTSTINETKICKYGKNGISLLRINEITDESDIDDEWEWKAYDILSVEVEVENLGDNDNQDYVVSLLFFDSSGKDITGDFVDDEDLLEMDVDNLDSRDDTTVTFNFRLDGEVDEGDYTMVVKLIKDGKEREQCTYDASQEVSVEKNERQVIVTNVEAPSTVQCGEQLELSFEFANIGVEDEDRVKIIAYNKELGINLFKEFDNIDSGDEQSDSMLISIPSTAQEKLYRIVISTEYDYDDDDEDYDEQSDSDDDYIFSFNVLGGCVDTTKPTISATLNSTAKVGEELIVNIAVKNNANQATSFFISVDGYSNWAEFMGVNPSLVTISNQGTGSAVLKLKPTESGQQTFNVKVVYNGKTVDQPVTVNVGEETSGLGFLNSLTDQFGKTTAYLIIAIIILIAVILLVLIIRAIIYLVRKS